VHEVQYWSENCCYAKNSIAQRIKIFSTSITRSNLDIFQLFWKHWIQLIQSYNYVFQSMWDSQRAEINSSGKRCWQLRDWAISILNIFDLICWVKSSYFSEIFESLNWSRSTLQSSLAKVLHQRASSRSSRLMIDWSKIDDLASRRRFSDKRISLSYQL